jgi:hypothetical protein
VKPFEREAERTIIRGDQRCGSCFGYGVITYDECGGSGAAPGCDPVFDEYWQRCGGCGGAGSVVCSCAEVHEP